MFYEFILTTDCNWNCYYCYFPKRNNKKYITKEIIDKYNWLWDLLNVLYQKNDIFSFQGGEIGLIDIDILEYLFSKFKHTIWIDTNGLFLEKGYHKKLKKYIEGIFYHVVEDPKNLIKVKKYNTDIHISYGVVGEPEYLYDFVKFNSHIYFDYVDIESSKKNFKYENYKKEIEQLLELPNVNKNKINEILKYRMNKNIKQIQQQCRISNKFLSFNLVDEILALCTTKNNHIGIPLTKENLIKMIISKPIQNFKNHNCDLCYRTCFSEGENIDFRNNIMLKKIINWKKYVKSYRK
jgi:organic radical activating enzyme